MFEQDVTDLRTRCAGQQDPCRAHRQQWEFHHCDAKHSGPYPGQGCQVHLCLWSVRGGLTGGGTEHAWWWSTCEKQSHLIILRYLFHYIREDGIVYLCMGDEAFGREAGRHDGEILRENLMEVTMENRKRELRKGAEECRKELNGIYTYMYMYIYESM